MNFTAIFGIRMLDCLGYHASLCHYLHDPTFSYFGTIPECDAQRQTNDDGIYHASIASHRKMQKVELGKNFDKPVNVLYKNNCLQFIHTHFKKNAKL